MILPGAVIDDTNSLVSGTFNNVDIRVESRFDELETIFKQATLSLHQDFGERLRFDGLAGYSTSNFRNPVQTTIALDALNVQGYSFDFSDGRNPAFRLRQPRRHQCRQFRPGRDPPAAAICGE